MKLNNYKPEEVVVAVDIGTTKVCAVAGRRNEHGKLEILGLGKVPCEGVIRGVVSNIEKTVRAIREAVSIVEKQIDAKVKVVHVGIAGQHIKSLHHHGILTRDNAHDEISQSDIDHLINDMYKLVLPPGDKILHVIPQEYTVDNEQGITEPIGMSGIRLEGNFHIITGQITASNNILRCIKKAGLEAADITLEPIASSAAVLNQEEKEAGIALVDIGGGTTDLTIFYEGIIRHTAVIPFGGYVITKDIKEGCTIMSHQAEKLKVKFGSALADEVLENKIITIPGLKGRAPKEISEKNLARIIQARIEEILEYIVYEIERSGYKNKLIGGIVLTGGGSKLKYIEELIEYHTGIPTKVSYPIEHLAHGYIKDLSSPVFSTSIGLLLNGFESRKYGCAIEVEEEDEVEEVFQPVSSPVSSVKMEENKPKDELRPESSNPEKEDSKKIEGGGASRDTNRYTDAEVNSEEKGFWNKVFNKTKDWFEASPDSDLN
ncbi:cell division protein FtsA [Membranihabitans maritimus]|uniref:cell division protein FtsA n=1 Tax=Membranihabitans maritimus TaxID=2904244 RepID=UPI001F0329EF|nr:cell division protein FtsA [Membranihabitans maritimus]